MNYELHPLCTLFPRLSDKELNQLADDIKANGQREPITLHDGMILDGGNRYRACLIAGVKPQFKKFAGGNIVSYVLSANMHRRHLSPGQQAAIVSSAQDWAKAHTHGGVRQPEQGATLHLDSVKTRAAESGASIRTQKMADKVVKADPVLGAQVARGEVSLPAAVKQVSPAKPEKAPEPSEVDQLRDQLAEMAAMCDELQADNESMSKAFEADDKLQAALAEAKRYREQARIAESRITGLMNEKNELIRQVKRLNNLVAKLEKASGSSVAA